MRRSMQSMLPLLLVLAGSDAVANTYFKCVDAKGAVTVQQTGCAVSSSQEEKKVRATKAPLSLQRWSSAQCVGSGRAVPSAGICSSRDV